MSFYRQGLAVRSRVLPSVVGETLETGRDSFKVTRYFHRIGTGSKKSNLLEMLVKTIAVVF